MEAIYAKGSEAGTYGEGKRRKRVVVICDLKIPVQFRKNITNTLDLKIKKCSKMLMMI